MNNSSKYQLVVFDFDGVMTDNRVILSETGEESVVVNRADGLGIRLLKHAGFRLLILSMETNPVVARRAQKLEIPVILGEESKANALRQYCMQNGIALNQVIYVGNDINDKEAMKLVGLKVVPADAHVSVKEIADWILDAQGGAGVVRELADRLGVSSYSA